MYAFADDVRLIWSNCLAYNPEGVPVRSSAQRLQSKFEDRFAQIENSRTPIFPY